MSPLAISYELLTRHRTAVVGLLDTLEKAGIERLKRSADKHAATATLLFVDADTPPGEVRDVVNALPNGPDSQTMAIALDRLPTPMGWTLLKTGVSEVISCPAMDDPAAAVISRLRYWRDIDETVRSLQKTLIGSSPAWTATLRQIAELARSDCPVLILGESGTGKELVAQQIHRLDGRDTKKECVVVDCTNLIPGLVGSELFGHEKGAFTHAINQRDGAIAMAHEGTLFLDELGELPLPLQAELLRVMQEGMYKRVGSDVWRRANFRLVSATNRNLTEEITHGRFRSDLYYRVSGWVCHLPPLRNRREDIPQLAAHFFRNRYHRSQPIDPPVLDFLMLKDYPGNIRELQQLVHRIASKHVGDGPITIGDIPRTDWPDFADADGAIDQPDELSHGIKRLLYQGIGLKEMKDIVTDIAKKEAIRCEQGNLKLAAQRLGCSERILQMHRREEHGALDSDN